MSELIVKSEASALMHKSLRCELARNLLNQKRYCGQYWLDCLGPLAESEGSVSLHAADFDTRSST
jgi:hypothetical protein